MECLERKFSKKIWKRVVLFVVTFGGGFHGLCLRCFQDFRNSFRNGFQEEIGKERHGLQRFWKRIFEGPRSKLLTGGLGTTNILRWSRVSCLG